MKLTKLLTWRLGEEDLLLKSLALGFRRLLARLSSDSVSHAELSTSWTLKYIFDHHFWSVIFFCKKNGNCLAIFPHILLIQHCVHVAESCWGRWSTHNVWNMVWWGECQVFGGRKSDTLGLFTSPSIIVIVIGDMNKTTLETGAWRPLVWRGLSWTCSTIRDDYLWISIKQTEARID